MAPQDFMPIQNFDYVEFYVGDAKHSAYYFTHGWGFVPIAYAGLETGIRDHTSYVLEQGAIHLIITSALEPAETVGTGRAVACELAPQVCTVPTAPVRLPTRTASAISEHVRLHGDGVKDVAFRVESAEGAYREATSRGAKGIQEPTELHDSFGSVKLASIAVYGDTIHTFVERQDYKGSFMPGFRTLESHMGPAGARPGLPDYTLQHGPPVGLTGIDHVVGNVELGKMNTWVNFYEKVMGFTQLIHFDDRQISTEYSALMSKVMQNGSGRIKLPINEPAPGRKKSQIEEYLDFYRTPGVQHLALITDDIISTVENLTERGIEFLRTPMNYYEHVLDRVGPIDEEIEQLANLGILIDHDDEGYLLQIFSKPVVSRPTIFFEVIERKGARGFGEGNFKALFEALEHEQELRGNL